MTIYADVIINISSLNQSFQYLVPPLLADRIGIGTAVRVPFGKGGRMAAGYVTGLSGEPKIGPERIKAIAEVEEKAVPAESRLIRLAAWMRQTYGSTMQQALTAVLPVKEKHQARSRAEDLQEDITVSEPEEPLTESQQKVIGDILREWETGGRPILLHGVTGSGKTRIYMELTAEMLKNGKQVILLIPEIALSWQTVRRFRGRFGNVVTVMNSRMSQGERFRQYERMKEGSAKIVIGPRSALFAPFPDLGLILIDEEQEPAYRSETMPCYDSREAALFRGKEEGARVLFGSATPSVDSYYRAQQGRYALMALPDRYGGAMLPTVQITDMREERKAGNLSLIGRPLEEALRVRLQRGEQSMLFLNRRGYSSVHTCQACGFVLKCRNCSVAMTLHKNGKLVCHYCGFQMEPPKKCPSCGSPHIRGFRYGTEKVEKDLKRLFPEARVLRMDADTTRRKNEYREILGQFSSHEADILIGTQMIVKGHDFPDVTLVGILAADLSLFSDDFRSQERTYQLLVQAVGRSGRAGKPGEAIIQTMHPDHDCIQQAVRQDYASFYEDEITAREVAEYPPVTQMLAVHGSSADEAQLRKAMQALRGFLLRTVPEEKLIGPAPEPVSRKKKQYLEVLYVRDDSEEHLIRLRLLMEKYIAINSGFHLIRFSYDLNP